MSKEIKEVQSRTRRVFAWRPMKLRTTPWVGPDALYVIIKNKWITLKENLQTPLLGGKWWDIVSWSCPKVEKELAIEHLLKCDHHRGEIGPGEYFDNPECANQRRICPDCGSTKDTHNGWVSPWIWRKLKEDQI